MSQILSNENQDLLKLIIDQKPRSLAELEKISHRKKSNLSRTLKTLEKYGIVELPKKDGREVLAEGHLFLDMIGTALESRTSSQTVTAAGGPVR